MKNTPLDFDQVYAGEMEYIAARRAFTGKEDIQKPERNLFGIASSGGGIRSATINLGFLDVLNQCGILSKADYLSTVSGGGYTGGYIQSKLRRTQDFATLFSSSDIKYLRDHGDYLTPGRNWRRFIDKLRLAGAFVASLLMNWVWIVLLALTLVGFLGFVGDLITIRTLSGFLCWTLWGTLLILGVHYFLHFLRHFRLWSSNVLNYTEGALLLLIVVPWVFLVSAGTEILQFSGAGLFLLSALGLALTGFFGDPNILTMHRFYRDRLGHAFLDAASNNADRVPLYDLHKANRTGKSSTAPYALFNACVNLLGRDDENFSGVKISDFFLLSPGFVGSKTTGYARTDSPLFRRITASTAVAVSGAALNPNMGTRTNRILTFFMSLLNLQLGYWAFNPGYMGPWRLSFTWWPYYQILLFLCRTDSTRSRVNISDGGHIENLGVYELLRRRCKLIVAVDAGEDPHFEFNDLKSLIIRARNELGITITFRPGHLPEDRIRPSASSGFSRAHFAIADVGELPHEGAKGTGYRALLVYVKSSLLEPKRSHALPKTDPDYWSTEYKTYHPSFPHESTIDQFFDPNQWDAYYTLGKFMAGDLLDINLRDPGALSSQARKLGKKSIDELIPLLSKRK